MVNIIPIIHIILPTDISKFLLIIFLDKFKS